MLCHDYVIPFLWGGAPTACRNTLDKHRTHFYKKHDRRFAVSKIPSCCSWGSVRRGSLCVYIAPRASHWWTMLRWGEVVAVVKASWKNIFCFKSLSEIQLVSVEVVNEESHPPKISSYYCSMKTTHWILHRGNLAHLQDAMVRLAMCRQAGGWKSTELCEEIQWLPHFRCIWQWHIMTSFLSWKKKLGSVEDTTIIYNI